MLDLEGARRGCLRTSRPAALAGLAAVLAGAAGFADAAPAARLALAECRLEHPLKISSVAARCGTLAVRLDRSRQDGATIDLRIAVVPALDRRANRPPLFLIAGGPGQGTLSMYLTLAPAFARVNREHDLVLVDQRGTGGSSPLVCEAQEDWLAEDRDPTKLREVTRACLDKYGPTVRFYTSAAAVSDLDAVRRALGYPVIDLYGASYGTRVAQLFMRRHGGATGAVILDGVTAPQEIIGPDTPRYAQHALDAIVARCAAAPSCSAAYPRLDDELAALRRSYGPQKLALRLDDPSSGLPLQVEFNRELLNASLRFLSYNGSQASLLPELVHRAAQGTLAPLAAQALMTVRQVRSQLAVGMQNSVICSEDVPFLDSALRERAAAKDTFLGTDQLDAFEEICRIWPHDPADADLHAPLTSDVPALLLSGAADPVTPPADAEQAARGLTHHRHLVLEGEGHGQVATGCVPTLMSQFLNSRATDTLDVSCLERHRPPPFFVNGNGPAP